MNALVLFLLTALIPMVVGFIYYNPKVVGGAWMKVNGFTLEGMREGSNMGLSLGLSYLLSVMLAFLLPSIVIHQSHLKSIVLGVDGLGVAGSEVQNLLDAFMTKYGTNFRTFKHGAFHGVIASLFFALPIVGINAIFERRGGKYVLIHLGYWAITLCLMGGCICQFYPAN
jgi:hypothetical protein